MSSSGRAPSRWVSAAPPSSWSATDSDAVGAVVRDVATTGARVAAFVGDPSDPVDADALSEMLAELFPGDPGGAEPA